MTAVVDIDAPATWPQQVAADADVWARRLRGTAPPLPRLDGGGPSAIPIRGCTQATRPRARRGVLWAHDRRTLRALEGAR